jgi:hypothetical protein
MKLVLAIFAAVTLVAMPSWSAGQTACGPAVVRVAVEVTGPEVSLADLLAPSACPSLLRAARSVRLGSAPLAGSARVLAGDQVRGLFQKVARDHRVASGLGAVPERITVRRAGGRASCAEIGSEILAALPAASSGAQTPPAEGFDCASAERVPAGSAVEVTRIGWNPELNSWEVAARCVRPADCVPFLVRVRGGDAPAERARFAPHVRGAQRTRPGAGPVAAAAVRAGQTATLTWDERGIRLLVPVICLEPGGIGENVRVRIRGGGRVLRAVVESAGELRVAS